MNRQRKYRAWYKGDIEKGEPLKFISHLDEEEQELFFIMEEDPEFKYSFYIPFMDTESWIVDDWTGLIDKNGKEIYEGDIVGGGHLGFTCAITFNDGSFQLKTNEHQGNSPINQNRIGRLEIIGNVYDNPELLDSTK